MIIQAFQSLHSHGFLKIQSGVDVSGLPLPTSVKESGNHAPLARAIVDPSLLDWFTIDKNPRETLQTGVHLPRKQGTRSFMPASADCFRLFRQIEVALKDCGLANSHHDINLSRGASWVRSKSIPSRGLPQQTIHFDYDTTRVGYDRLQLPMSLRFTHQPSSLLMSPDLTRSLLARLCGTSPFRTDQALEDTPARLFCSRYCPVTLRTTSGVVVAKTWHRFLMICYPESCLLQTYSWVLFSNGCYHKI